MNFLTKIGTSILQISSLVLVIGYLLGVLNLHFSESNNYCVMTYMYEYPQFVRISVTENAVYPQYGLYVYSEGRHIEQARKMWFDGVPVLFLPGNSGSHMQVRSLASVALRKALSNNYEYHFDYYTVSLNEELSGLYGGVLQSQTQFAAECISKILSLYKSNKYTKNVPTSVILVGHSMGGLIAKRLMAYPSTLNMTSLAITLASPLEAPVMNTDMAMNDYYKLMDFEWDMYVNNDASVKKKKMLISFGNGPRDVLMPSGLTSSNDSYLSALTTAVPGVWVSPDHVSIVWCKQLVLAINRFLFSIVDPLSGQLLDNEQTWKKKASQFFQANRTMVLDPHIPHTISSMQADAFWYEDSRRIYQISRPEIKTMTYLMIRLVTFHQNRFVAIEAINLDDKEWIFGCNAKFTHATHRYCKQATALSELSRWTAAANTFGKRKLATIDLHSLKDMHPDWTHVVVKVSPTRKPIKLNVDINDYGSRVINVDLPSDLTFGKSIIKAETDQDSLYYELVLPGLITLHQAYLLYVEPTANCKASRYHVSAELHVPWASNNEYTHYFTQSKQSPMKLRLFSSNPNITGGEPSEYVKVTLLLDPQCTFSISIAQSWYHRLAQLARNYSIVLIPYMAAIVLLAARSSLMGIKETGYCMSIHRALMSEGVKPYYALVFARLGSMVFMSMPLLAFLFENASWSNVELHYFTRSLLVLPTYMTALGILNISAAALIAVMVFSSQLAHRLLLRIVWKGGPSIAEKVASGLQKIPMVVSAALVCAVPLSCGAASLAAGAAFYAFMISKMYEEYLEDFVYKLMAKFAARFCRIFKSKKVANNENESETNLVVKDTSIVAKTTEIIEENKMTDFNDKDQEHFVDKNSENEANTTVLLNNEKTLVAVAHKENDLEVKSAENCNSKDESKPDNYESDIDDGLHNLNFHVMMFLLWFCVALVNVPALLTWAKNFKYSMVLKPDTSYHTGLIMSACSACIWQMEGPRKKLRYYDEVAALLFTMAVFILALGPLSLTIVNYGLTFMFAVITIQQLCDKEMKTISDENDSNENDIQDQPKKETGSSENMSEENAKNDNENNQEKSSDKNTKDADGASNNCDVCKEGRIYTMFKNFKDKFSFSEDS